MPANGLLSLASILTKIVLITKLTNEDCRSEEDTMEFLLLASSILETMFFIHLFESVSVSTYSLLKRATFLVMICVDILFFENLFRLFLAPFICRDFKMRVPV